MRSAFRKRINSAVSSKAAAKKKLIDSLEAYQKIKHGKGNLSEIAKYHFHPVAVKKPDNVIQLKNPALEARELAEQAVSSNSIVHSFAKKHLDQEVAARKASKLITIARIAKNPKAYLRLKRKSQSKTA